jgi:glutathione S-transferase
LHPADPLKKAQNRAWMEYTSPLYMGTFNIIMAKEKEPMDNAIKEFGKTLKGLEKAKQNKLWFNGDDFSMVDISAAPIFTRVRFIKEHCNLDLLKDFPNLQQWSADLLSRQTVIDSVVDGFDDLLLTRMKGNESYILNA